MKKLLVVSIIALFLCLSAGAQNIIVTNDGNAIKAYNIEMAGNSVYYQTTAKSDAPIQKINKSDILIIKMEDGTKVDPNAPAPTSAPAKVEEAPAPEPQTGSILTLKGDAAEKNAAMIADFNKVLAWEPDEKFLKKHQGKIGNGYAGIMWVENDSQLYNGEVTISYQRCYFFATSQDDSFQLVDYRSNMFFNPVVVVKVRNNTDKMIYLDLASCFTICGDDSTPYFVPGTTTVNNSHVSQSSGSSTNLKVDNNSLRTSNESQYSGNSSSVTKVKEARQYVSVAPKSTLSLEPHLICTNTTGRDQHMYLHMNSLRMTKSVFPFTNTQYGQIFEFSEAESPFQFGTCVSYSFKPDHSDMHTIRTELYLKYVMCTSSSALFSYTIEGDFHKRYPFWVPFYVGND